MTGHLGEPFVEIDYQKHREKVLVENTTGSTGKYERVAFVRPIY